MADVSRRVSQLESEVAELRRALGANAKPAAFSFPRERWLGRTVARSASYPEPGDGNTFEVELLSSAFAPVSPGNSALTNRPRGPVVVARTWPAQYLAEGTYVTVDRIKGPDAGGEWWIAGGAGAQAELIRWAELSYGYPTSSGNSLIVSGANWQTELLAIDRPDGTPSGNAGTIQGQRLRVDITGVYHVTAQATVKVATEYLSGGGFTATDWQLKLWVFDEEISVGVQGYAQGRNYGIEAHTTVHASGIVEISSAGIVSFQLEGLSYLPPYSIEVKQWSLFLLKADEA